MLLTEVLEEYLVHCKAKGFTPKTIKNKMQEYKQFKIFLIEKRGITELESITVHDLKSYVRLKQNSGLQPQSIVSMGKMVKAFFNWCVQEEYLAESPMAKVVLPKIPKKILKGFHEEEVSAMINAFSFKTYLEARNKSIIALLADCGLRAMEIRTLRMGSIRDDNTIVVWGKGNKERIVFISPALRRILIKYERLRKQYFKDKLTVVDRYFLNYTGGEISHTALWNVIVEAGKRAGVEEARVSPHTFRHFYAVNSLKNGVDLYTLSRLLGHAELTTTQAYLRTLDDKQLIDKALASSPLMGIVKGLRI